MKLKVLLAVLLALGIAAVVVLGAQLPGDRLLPGDRGAAELATDARSATLVDVAKVVTDLAWAPVIAAVVLAGSALAVIRRRAALGFILLVGFVIATLASHELKGLVGRPRPPHRLAAAAGASFPSGHSTASIAYVTLAVVLGRAFLRSRGARATLLALGIAIAIAVGLTRIELRVHYLSDVLGGWGLGVAAYSLSALLVLLVGALRHNAGGAG